MQFLKTLFWIALTVVLVLFAKANWNAVTLKLWGGLEADVKLPVLVLFAFLLGFLPTLILYRTRLWGLKRRLDPADMVPDPRRDRLRPLEIGRVDGDEDRAPHGVGQALLSVATRPSPPLSTATGVGTAGGGATLTWRSAGSRRRFSPHSRVR